MHTAPEIIFPGLGITIETLPSSFTIFGFRIAFYGLIIAIGMITAVVLSYYRAKKINQFADNYIDIGIISIICGVIGARIYYVVFSLDRYHSFAEVINIRNGGLAIYGGIIGGFLAGYFVCRYKKMSFLRALDIAAPGIVIAQAMGRWGNFFNKEAYGDFTESLFRMQIRYDAASPNGLSENIMNNLQTIDGTKYIQVHPTFLYESVFCVVIFILILVFGKWQRYNGEVVLWYLGGYALQRIFLEGLRTDQLLVGNIPVSQLLSVAIFAGAFTLLLINRIRLIKKSWEPDFKLVLDDGDPGTKGFAEALKEERRAKKGKGSKGEWTVRTVNGGEEMEKDPSEAAPKEPAADTGEEAKEASEGPEEDTDEEVKEAPKELAEDTDEEVKEEPEKEPAAEEAKEEPEVPDDAEDLQES